MVKVSGIVTKSDFDRYHVDMKKHTKGIVLAILAGVVLGVYVA
jgi:hypothetical protein